MVDRKEELLKFVKSNFKSLVLEEFPEKVYKESKRAFFFDGLKNELGIPKDREIAAEAMEHLFKIGYFPDEAELQKVLQRPFFLRNLPDNELYLQRFRSNLQHVDVDLGKIQEQEYKAKKIKELQEEIVRERAQEIDEKIRMKKEEYEAIPSVLDNAVAYPEPIEVIEEKPEVYLPWWQKLKLRADPFPTIDGLGTIKEEDYEEIIVKTTIYEKYVSYIKNSHGELFKNTVFYGQFGTGKTTFFEYLRKPLIQNRVYPVLIRLSAEPDYQNFLIRFKQKLFRELLKTYEDLSGGVDLSKLFGSTSLDENITSIFQKISKDYPCLGFVIMIDDIYKIKDYTDVALRFLNQLQTFRGELMSEAGFSNIGFFISAPLDWKPILQDDPVFSGSVSREESMPMITMHEALNMLNRRLEAFATNVDNVRKFKIDFVHQIYRRLESKRALTFRHFIKEVVRQFEDGNFDILVSNPVVIGAEDLRKIKTKFEQDFAVSSGIDEILNAPMTPKSKNVCFQLLIQVLIRKGADDDSDLVANRMFYFMALKNAKLIVKTRERDKTVWKASPELAGLNSRIYAEHGLSMEDYFYKIYGDKLEKELKEKETVSEEVVKCRDLIASIRNRRGFDTIQALLDDSLKLHQKITKAIDNSSISIDQSQVKRDCNESILLLTRAVAVFYGKKDAVNLDFWNDFFRYPDSVSDFIKRASSDESKASDIRIWYIGAAYVAAFEDILDLLADQIHKSTIFMIPISGLKSEEASAFDDARNAYSKNEYDNATRIISDLVETKIREFLFNILSLQYGEKHNRLRRIMPAQRDYIRDNSTKDVNQGLSSTDNEFAYLNRHDYKQIFCGPASPGNKNWAHTFSKLFYDWKEQDLLSYLDKFAKLNLQSSHHKHDVLTHEQQSTIYEFLVKSIDFIRRINGSYTTFVRSIQKVDTGGNPRHAYYFSLDSGKDLQELTPITIHIVDAKRILEQWKKTEFSHIDLSNRQQIEQKYGLAYREFYAILSALKVRAPTDIQLAIVKEIPPSLVLQITIKSPSQPDALTPDSQRSEN